MKIHIPIVLFFTAGMVPTSEELEQGLAARARFRNASLDDGKVERCDFVMGAAPDQYEDVPRLGTEAPADAAPDADAKTAPKVGRSR